MGAHRGSDKGPHWVHYSAAPDPTLGSWLVFRDVTFEFPSIGGQAAPFEEPV
jgi:hypothetical protein